ncbi:lipoprotein NlpI [Thorsellia anophelis]|uniref:Lipoprotein NlpI n=1 Tax=Thorsellia anophelis DSM 18579 TaxID=1123402 RepID=A0A1I0DEF1_9GAMM|nr:lipoprotein NlpI [Thorsellia anophelis]SET30720.1 lipoprotein NlpI [Thorsellia anophelis DSM 18579]
MSVKTCLRVSSLISAILISGCAGTHANNDDMLMAVPLQSTLQQEVMLARMEQILATGVLVDDERAQLLYERGVLYDSLGLRALARNDFTQALMIRPDIPEIYNYLGIYLTQAGDFDAAYEAFDSVLELDSTYTYARLNRGIALYYGGRFALAQEDLLAFYQEDKNDPYRTLWLYLAERQKDERSAKKSLQDRFNEATERDYWGWNIVEFYLGNISQKELMHRLESQTLDNITFAEYLTESYFYLGKYYLNLGDVNSAVPLFKKAVANNVHNFVEHRYALLELALLAQLQEDLAESNSL